MPIEYIAGTLEPDLTITVPESITGATAYELRWKKPDGTVSTVPLVAVDLATGKLKRVWIVDDLVEVGIHVGHVLVTKASTKVQGYGPFYWWVRPAL